MGISNPYQMYKNNQVNTASNNKLVLMVFDSILNNIRQAKHHIEKKNYVKANKNLLLVQDLISELKLSLNIEAGEIAKNLYLLYDFLQNRIIEANIKKDIKILNDADEILAELYSAWKEVIKK